MILYRGIKDKNNILNYKENTSYNLKDILFFSDRLKIAKSFWNHIIEIKANKKDIISEKEFNKYFNNLENQYNNLVASRKYKEAEELENIIYLNVKDKLKHLNKKILKCKLDKNDYEYLIDIDTYSDML